jgi:hypothetical protein
LGDVLKHIIADDAVDVSTGKTARKVTDVTAQNIIYNLCVERIDANRKQASSLELFNKRSSVGSDFYHRSAVGSRAI